MTGNQYQQTELFDTMAESPALASERVEQALDELFHLTYSYRDGAAYRRLLDFVGRFHFYSPFNALLVHIQRPGARFVATAQRWLREYGRRIRPGAAPLVILQPMGPVMFVFDVGDTEPEEGAPPLPPEVIAPFAVGGGTVGSAYERTIDNAARDGVRVAAHSAGSQSAGALRPVFTDQRLKFLTRARPTPEMIEIPVRYHLLLNADHDRESRYATLVHELAHLYCGHLGAPEAGWWPNRPGVDVATGEFEAESVSHLLCTRLGIDSPSERYLAAYIEANTQTPPISLDAVIKAAGLIEQMGQRRLPLRPQRKRE